MEERGAPAIEPLGAPADLVRPTGRVADEALARSKARMAALARKALLWIGVPLAAAVLLALLFTVALAFWPKPDL